MKTTSDNLAFELSDIRSKKRGLASTIKQYLREHGGKVEMPDDWEGDDREIETTSMAVMNDYESCVDAYIEGVELEGDTIVLWGNRSDGQGHTGKVNFDKYLNSEGVANWLLRMEEMTEEKM